ncbi:integrase [Pandoraea sputorum]|uniref:Integrase n=1 Tax=Pandoraea sputorum TaxID=93222 RepID=A0A5E5BII0_9BURK|nr:integrase [Pandoraea sputorum]
MYRVVRHDLETMNKRLTAWEAKSAPQGWELTETRLAVLERATLEKETHGEFESECPGDCGAQNTFYVGTLKGVGRVCPQTFVDTDSKVALAQRYDRKTPLPAADRLNERMPPGVDSRGIPLMRILTDRGTASCAHPPAPRVRARSGGAKPRPHPNSCRVAPDQPHRRCGCTRRGSTSAIASPFARKLTTAPPHCRPTSISGLTRTTHSASIQVGGAMATRPCRLSTTLSRSPKRHSCLIQSPWPLSPSGHLSGQVSANTVSRVGSRNWPAATS